MDATTHAGVPQARTLSQYFERTCDRIPENPAVVCGPVTLTYRELDRRANRLAHRLRGHGVGRGDPVGLRASDRLTEYIALLGVLKAGAAYLPLTAEQAIGDFPLAALITGPAGEDQPPGCPVVEPACAEAEPAHRPGADLDPAAPCYLTCPRGLDGVAATHAFTHQDVITFVRVAAPGLGMVAGDRVYQGTSISQEFHLHELWPCFFAGATVVVPMAGDLNDLIAAEHVTVFCGPSTQLSALRPAPPSVRGVLVHGAPLPAAVVREWSGRQVFSCSGPTRASRWGRANGGLKERQ